MRSQITTGLLTLIVGFATGWLFFGTAPWSSAGAQTERVQNGQAQQQGANSQSRNGGRDARSGQRGHGGGHGGGGHGAHGHGGHGGHGGGRSNTQQNLNVEATIASLSRALSLTQAEQAQLCNVYKRRDAMIKEYQKQLGIALNGIDRLQLGEPDYSDNQNKLSVEAKVALDKLIATLIESRQAIVAELDDDQLKQMQRIRRSGLVKQHLSHWP